MPQSSAATPGPPPAAPSLRERLTTLLPPSAADPATAATELLRAVIVRSNFIPGVRHRLGWRGVASCPSDPSCNTARVAGRGGVYGLALAEGPRPGSRDRAEARIFYFPHPDEDMAEGFSVQAGIHVQGPGYMDRVRDFAAHPDFAALFPVGAVEVACDPDAPFVVLGLTAPERHVILALDGVVVETPQGPVRLVPPGEADQDLHSLDAAMPLLRTLAASTAYCLDAAPDALVERRRSLPHFVYDAQGFHGTRPWKEGRERHLALGFSAPDEALVPAGGPWPEGPALSWRAPAPVPEAYAEEPWWSPHVPGASHSLDKAAMGIADPPRLVVLTGFLGAGKTSFLSRFIEQQAARNAFTAVIQNEIGAKGLDGRLVGQRYAVTELDEGCVCCSLAGSLRPALAEVLGAFQPDFVVLETTGLANPANLLDEIAEIGDQAAFGSVTTVVDAPLAAETLERHEVARSQIRLADVILLNKADLVPEAELEHIEARLRAMNPMAPVHRCEHGDVPASLLYGVNMRPARRPRLPLMGEAAHAATHEDDGIASLLLDQESPLDREAFLAWIDALPRGVLRAKGVLDLAGVGEAQVVQLVPGRLDLAPAGDADAGDRFLVLIGSGLDAVAPPARLRPRPAHAHHHHHHHHGPRDGRHAET